MTQPEHDRVIREGAAIGSVAPRRQIALSGKDRATYLQGLLTNDIPALTPGSGCYAAWLTAQGRMLTDLHVLQSDEMLLLDVPAQLIDAIVARLDQFIFTEDVQVASLAETLSGLWCTARRRRQRSSARSATVQTTSRRGRNITTSGSISPTRRP